MCQSERMCVGIICQGWDTSIKFILKRPIVNSDAVRVGNHSCMCAKSNITVVLKI